MQTNATELNNQITTEYSHCQTQAVNKRKGQNQDRNQKQQVLGHDRPSGVVFVFAKIYYWEKWMALVFVEVNIFVWVF